MIWEVVVAKEKACYIEQYIVPLHQPSHAPTITYHMIKKSSNQGK